jgi:integrase
MMIVALATGLRKSNVAGLMWERIDLERRCCYVPGYETKVSVRPWPMDEGLARVG